MFTKEHEKTLKRLKLSKQDFYDIFWWKKFIEEEKLALWIKEDAPEGVVIKMRNGKKEPNNIVMIYIFCKNWLELFTDGFFLPQRLQNQWIRTRCFAAQIRIAQKLWYKMLTSKCSRSDDRAEFGYIVGPLLGYNWLNRSVKVQVLKAQYCERHKISKLITAKIMKAQDILDLCSFKEWRECRKHIGRMFDAEFDLTQGSKSMKTFNKHLKKYT